MNREALIKHAKALRQDLNYKLPNGVGNTIDALVAVIEADKTELKRQGYVVVPISTKETSDEH